MISSTEPPGEHAPPAEFHFWAALTRSVRILFSNPFFFIGGLGSVPILFFGPAHQPKSFDWTYALFVFLVTPVLGFLCQTAVVYAALGTLLGRPVSAAESLRVALPRAMPALGAGALACIIVGIGFVLLLVPGIIATLAFFVIVPVCVVERLGPSTSLSRSAELTAGYRWHLLAYVLILAVPGVLAFAVEQALNRPPLTVPDTILTFAWDALANSFSNVFGVVVYRELRRVKEHRELQLDRVLG